MRAIQRRGNLFDYCDRALGAQPPAVLADVVDQIAALDEPHVDVEPAVDFAVAVDGHHMRIVQTCSNACLAPEPLLKLVVLGQVCGQHLQRDDPIGGGIESAVDLSHATAPQDFQQLILPE